MNTNKLIINNIRHLQHFTFMFVVKEELFKVEKESPIFPEVIPPATSQEHEPSDMRESCLPKWHEKTHVPLYRLQPFYHGSGA
jgi:hypothetical protein